MFESHLDSNAAVLSIVKSDLSVKTVILVDEQVQVVKSRTSPEMSEVFAYKGKRHRFSFQPISVPCKFLH